MPVEMPDLFREALTSVQWLDVEGWWGELDDADRREAIAFWESVATDHLTGFRIQACVDDRTPEEDRPTLDRYWNQDFCEFLVNHEIEVFKERTFFICHATPCAQGCIRRGHIPKDFTCPLATPDCRMTHLLAQAGGRDVFLRIVPIFSKDSN